MPSVSSTQVFSLRKPSAASASGIMTLVSRMDTFLMPGTPCSATCKHRAPSFVRMGGMQVKQHDLGPTDGQALDAWQALQCHLPEQCLAFPGGTGKEYSTAGAQAEPVLVKHPGMHALRKAPAAHNNAGA